MLGEIGKGENARLLGLSENARNTFLAFLADGTCKTRRAVEVEGNETR